MVNSVKGEVHNMRGNRLLLFAMASGLTLVANPAFAGDKIKNQTFVVNLTSPISTKDSKPGDTFTARVIQPSDFDGAVVEGHIRKVEPAQNMEAPKAHIDFAFETLTVGDTTYKIQADLQDVVNSKGMAKVDEEGQVVSKGNGAKRAMMGLGGAGIGAMAGGMIGGGMGSLIGGAAGGALGYVVALDMTASSHNIEFNPGTHFTLVITSKGVDKNADASAIHQQEAANEATMAANAAKQSEQTAAGNSAPTADAQQPQAQSQDNQQPGQQQDQQQQNQQQDNQQQPTASQDGSQQQTTAQSEAQQPNTPQ
jgi:hypothetical protein